MEEKKFCKFCGEEIDKSSIVCPKCGRQLQFVANTEETTRNEASTTNKNQPKFYEQQWFMWVMLVFFAPVGIFLMWKFNNNLKQKTKIILTVVFGIFFLITMFGGSDKKEKIVWDDIKLKEKLPTPKKLYGEVIINNSDWVDFEITNISMDEYEEYVEKCREKGYTLDLEYDPWDTNYGAFDKNGYYLQVDYYEYSEEMDVSLESPKKDSMKEIEWPTSGLGALLPKPKSTLGEIISNSSDRFSIYIGDMTINDYNEYVKSCESKGFINDYDKSDKSYSATNNSGHKLYLNYIGANVIEISLYAPEEDTQPTQSTQDNTNNENTNTGLSDDFKKAMDDYEAFMDEYISFMEKYKNSNGTDTSLLMDYTKYLQKYSEMLSSFEKWENEDLNAEETKYYIEVQARVSKKLIDASIE